MGMGILVGQSLNVFLHRCTAIEYGSLDIRQVLAEAGVLILDLERKLSSVAHHENGGFSRNRLNLLECREHENCSFSQSRFRLAEDVRSQNGLRDADLLDCGKATKS